MFKLLRDKRCVGAFEYILVASLILVAAIAAYDKLGSTINNLFTKIEASL